MNAWLWAAAAVSLLTFWVHTFVGGPRVAVPLLADEGLPRVAKWLAYYCWHIVTLYLLGMAGGFASVASGFASMSLAWFLLFNSAAFSLLSAAVTLKAGIAPYRFPSTILFATVAFTAAIGLS